MSKHVSPHGQPKIQVAHCFCGQSGPLGPAALGVQAAGPAVPTRSLPVPSAEKWECVTCLHKKHDQPCVQRFREALVMASLTACRWRRTVSGSSPLFP